MASLGLRGACVCNFGIVDGVFCVDIEYMY